MRSPDAHAIPGAGASRVDARPIEPVLFHDPGALAREAIGARLDGLAGFVRRDAHDRAALTAALDVDEAYLCVLVVGEDSGDFEAYESAIGSADSEGPLAACEPTERDDLAGWLFTSGSTGRPKAVVVTHGNIMRLLDAPNYIQLDPKTVMLQLAPHAFDAATLEIWGPLLHGGRVVMPPAGPVSAATITTAASARSAQPASPRQAAKITAASDSTPATVRIAQGISGSKTRVPVIGPTYRAAQARGPDRICNCP